MTMLYQNSKLLSDLSRKNCFVLTRTRHHTYHSVEISSTSGKKDSQQLRKKSSMSLCSVSEIDNLRSDNMKNTLLGDNLKSKTFVFQQTNKKSETSYRTISFV